MAKVALRFGWTKQSKNLDRYLIYNLLFNIFRSISQSDLSHKSEPSNSVHIEIKNMSKSQDHLATANIGPGPIHQQSGRPLRSSSSSSRRSSIVSEGHQQMGHQASVSVVNLKHSSVDNLPQVAQTAASAGSGGQNIAGGGQGKPRYLSPNRQTFGQPTKSQILRPSSLLPGRMVMGIKARTTSNPKLKSHSVENLIQADPSNTVLGLKPANSEMNIMVRITSVVKNSREGNTKLDSL